MQTSLLVTGILSLQTPFQVHGFSVTGQILTAEVTSSLIHGLNILLKQEIKYTVES